MEFDDLIVHRLEKPFEKNSVWLVTLQCGRYNDRLDIVLFINSKAKSIMKVGQYPSIADIHINKIKSYKKVLSEDDLREFTRAIGLVANGVGIGSFVYLRRIFERLIYDTYDEAIQSDVSLKSREEFNSLRMNEKIQELHGFLPASLIEMKEVYGIISKGIHELSEKECLSYFDVIRSGIELILDEKLEMMRKKAKKEHILAAINKINAQIQSV